MWWRTFFSLLISFMYPLMLTFSAYHGSSSMVELTDHALVTFSASTLSRLIRDAGRRFTYPDHSFGGQSLHTSDDCCVTQCFLSDAAKVQMSTAKDENSVHTTQECGELCFVCEVCLCPTNTRSNSTNRSILLRVDQQLRFLQDAIVELSLPCGIELKSYAFGLLPGHR